MNGATVAALRVLAVLHVIVGVALLPACLLFGLLPAPLLLLAPLWLIVLGVRAWRADARVLGALLVTHVVALGIAVLLIGYGVFALRAAHRSAAAGGGLLGTFGLIPLGMGSVLAGLSVLTLLFAARLWAKRSLPPQPGVQS